MGINRPETVVLDAGANQRLLDIAARADANEGIRQGMEDLRQWRLRPAKEALDEFRIAHGIPR